MKPSTLAALMIAMAVTVAAQNDYSAVRVGPAAEQVKLATGRLAQRTLQNILRSPGNSRNEIQDALLAQQVDATAAMLIELTRNRRPGMELREVGGELTDLSRRAPSYSSESGLWRQVQSAVAEFTRELSPVGPPNFPGPPPRPIVGRVAWRGRIDDRAQLVVRGNTVEVRTITGAPNGDGTATFTSPLPTTPVEVGVTKTNGRGSVRVLQQPSRANDFTAVIEVYDNDPGAQEYRLDIYWQALGRGGATRR